MSLNGSGVFNVNSAGQPVVAGTLITAAAFNAYTADVAAALSTALYSDGQRVNAANLAMGGYKLTGLAAGAAPGDSVRYEQLLAWLLLSGGNMTGGINGKLSTVASHATTADIFATTVGNLIDWTGTATTTAFAAAPQAGAERTLVCADAAVFTAGADMLIDGLASGQSYTATAGDKVIVRAVTTTRFRLTVFPYSGVSRVVQSVEATPYTTATSTASAILLDNSIPQITEGTELATVSITPTSASNRLRIEADFSMVVGSQILVAIAALFQDTTANALAASTHSFPGADYPSFMTLVHEMEAGTTSATTFRLRIGPNVGTLYINRSVAGIALGGVNAVRLRVTEVRV